jgi:early secretory antigenic target protein ESAT-6
VANITVNFESIAGLASSLGSASDGMQQTLDQLEANLDPLRTQFTGEAAEAYQIAKAKWASQMTQMTAFLASISNAAASAGKAYTATERDIANSF